MAIGLNADTDWCNRTTDIGGIGIATWAAAGWLKIPSGLSHANMDSSVIAAVSHASNGRWAGLRFDSFFDSGSPADPRIGVADFLGVTPFDGADADIPFDVWIYYYIHSGAAGGTLSGGWSELGSGTWHRKTRTNGNDVTVQGNVFHLGRGAVGDAQTTQGAYAYWRAWTTTPPDVSTLEGYKEGWDPTASSAWGAWPLADNSDVGDDSGNSRDLTFNGSMTSETSPSIIPDVAQANFRFFEAGDELPHYDAGTIPVIEAADCTASGSNTAADPVPVAYPAYAAGDLLVTFVTIDDDDTINVPAAGPNSETRFVIGTGDSGSADGPAVAGMYWIGTATQSGSTQNWDLSASEEWVARTFKVPAGEFDPDNPADSISAIAGDSGTGLSVPTPSWVTTRASGRVVVWIGIDTVPLLAAAPGWGIVDGADIGAVAGYVAVRGAVDITFGASGTAASSSSVATISALSFGAAASDRLIAAAITVEANVTISSVTIGGVSATSRASAIDTVPNPDMVAQIWVAAVPTGTSGDVVVTLSTGDATVAASTYRVVNATEVPSDSDTATGSAATISITGLTVPVFGAGICCFGSVTDTTGVVWTGAIEAADIDAGIHRHSSAIVSVPGTNTITADGATAAQALCGIAFAVSSNQFGGTTLAETIASVNFACQGDSSSTLGIVINAPRIADGRTPLAAAGADVELEVDTDYGWQFRIENDGIDDQDDFKAQYKHTEGTNTWTDISSSSDVIVATLTSDFANGADVAEYIGGTGTYVSNNNAALESTGALILAAALAAGQAFEGHLNFQIVGADVDDVDHVQLRIVRGDGTVLEAYTDTPTITVNKETGGFEDGAGSADGTSTAAAVGKLVKPAAGSSAGTATASAVGRSTASAAGSAAGTATASAVGQSIATTAAAADGTATAAAVGEHVRQGAGAAAGEAAAAATGQSTAQAAGSATGAATAAATGQALSHAAGSADGTSTAAATGKVLKPGAGAAAGTATASAASQSLAAGVGSAAGLATTSAVGRSTANAAASAAGVATAAATGQSTAQAVGSAAGVATVTGISDGEVAGVGSAAGTATATAVGQAIHKIAGATSGFSTASAAGQAISSSAGASAGVATAAATGRAILNGVGAAAGASTAAATAMAIYQAAGACSGSSTAGGVGKWVATGIGASVGSCSVTAVGASLTFADAVGLSEGIATVLGFSQDPGFDTQRLIIVAPPAWLAVVDGQSRIASVSAPSRAVQSVRRTRSAHEQAG